MSILVTTGGRRSDWLDRPILVTCLYLLFGWTWIGVSDWWAYRYLQDEAALTRFQSTKGIVFVTVTGLLFLGLLVWRKRRQENAETELEMVVGQLPGFLWTTDRDLRLQSIIGQDLAGFQVEAERLSGRHVGELIRGAERRAVVEAGHRRALAGESADFEVDLLEHDLVVRVEPLCLPSGRISGCVGFALDVTGLGMTDVGDSVRQAMRRGHVLATVGSLVLEVAHKLKNPLFAMTAALDAFEERVGEHPATVRHREILRQQVARVQALVDGLQEYGRMRDLKLELCNVDTLVQNVAKELAHGARKAHVDVVARVSPENLQGTLDREAFAEVLRRVGTNAVQHSSPGDVVEMTARRSPDEPSRLEILVDDAGPGFHPGDHERVFQPLFSRGTAGAGLGLSIAERIVHLHGGDIELGTSPRGGARVRITLASLAS